MAGLLWLEQKGSVDPAYCTCAGAGGWRGCWGGGGVCQGEAGSGSCTTAAAWRGGRSGASDVGVWGVGSAFATGRDFGSTVQAVVWVAGGGFNDCFLLALG